TKHTNHASSHIFAAMVAGAFDHRDRARVAHGEALACNAFEVSFAGDGAVKHRIADDDIGARIAVHAGRWSDDHPTARKTLTDIVVGVASEFERDTMGEEGAEALTGGALQAKDDPVLGQAFMSGPARKL